MAFIKKYLKNMFEKSVWENYINIKSEIKKNVGKNGKVLDVGCDTGAWIMKIKNECNFRDAYGIDIRMEAVNVAISDGVIAKQVNIDHDGIPFENDMFDICTSNQVIEHLTNIDNFASEIYRVTKPGGKIVISTENLSSWHNIASLIFGWQPFSSVSISTRIGGLGNPIAFYRGVVPDYPEACHKSLFAYRGKIEFWQTHGFRDVKIIGAGYYPFPAFLGRIDPRHSHFITATATKY